LYEGFKSDRENSWLMSFKNYKQQKRVMAEIREKRRIMQTKKVNKTNPTQNKIEVTRWGINGQLGYAPQIGGYYERETKSIKKEVN
jgi:hypothetical protein